MRSGSYFIYLPTSAVPDIFSAHLRQIDNYTQHSGCRVVVVLVVLVVVLKATVTSSSRSHVQRVLFLSMGAIKLWRASIFVYKLHIYCRASWFVGS